MTYKENEYHPDYVSPPGETLQEMLEDREMTQVDLSGRIGMSRKHVKQILGGKAPITTDTALRLERVLNVPAQFWNNREQRYREFLTRQAEQERLEKNREWVRGFTGFKKMAEFGWVPHCESFIEKSRSLLNFFAVASPEAWQSNWGNMSVRYRKSEKHQANLYALAAWLRQGEIQAQRIQCEAFDERRFRKALGDVRSLTVEPPEVFQTALVEECAKCGVAVVFVPELPKTASGAARWLSPDKALIQLSLKYKTDDHLWFTFFHEAGHILLHPKKAIFLEGKKHPSKEEHEANQFSARILIPEIAYRDLTAAGRPTLDQVREFADSIDIAPGIVVGQLQHRGVFGFERGNGMKRKLMWVHKAD